MKIGVIKYFGIDHLIKSHLQKQVMNFPPYTDLTNTHYTSI